MTRTCFPPAASSELQRTLAELDEILSVLRAILLQGPRAIPAAVCFQRHRSHPSRGGAAEPRMARSAKEATL